MLKDIRKESLKKKWQGLIKDFQESSLPVKDYVQERHIQKSSLYKWSKRLGMPLKKVPVPLSFIELQPLDQEAAPYVPQLELFAIEVMVSKGGSVKVDMPWPKMVEFVKALL